MITCRACGHDNPETNKFCGECAAPLVRAEAASEARKTVTIVFCDVVGSTAMGEALDPESLRRVMQRFFDAMRAAIERHGGTVEKFIGDAVMAVFGVPQVHEDDALQGGAGGSRDARGARHVERRPRPRPRDHARLPDRGEHRRGRGRVRATRRSRRGTR